jgi:hypothetical protein
MRKEFDVLSEDQEYLDSLELPWEAIVSQGRNWILIQNFPLPDGYIGHVTTAAIEMATGYPRAQLDMIYFYPDVKRIDAATIGALTHRNIDGKNFQRWSRHRTGTNPWREGVDNLSTHMALVEYWLEREFKIRPRAVSI